MSDNTVVTENDLTSVVEVTSAGPAGPPGGALTIQDQGVDEGLLTDKINFAGSTVSVVNDTEAEIATVTVNAADPGANTNITSLGGITGGISSPDYVQFDTAAAAAGAVGRLLWNDTDGTLEFGLKGGNVTLQIGQEQVIRVTNTAGVTMTDGQAVYITGSTGNHLNVTLAQANAEATSSKTLAVVTETIANNSTGFAASAGLVRGLDTSALTEGAAIWLSPTVPGGLTTTRPTAPDHAVLIGWCVRQHASVGVIYVHIANGYELEELHNVLITAAANNQVLRYDAATGLWKNATISPTLTLTGDVSGSATFTDLGNATLTATVADDSHNHVISNVDGLQDALDSKLPAVDYNAADVLTKLKTVDGVDSGLDADLLDGQDGAYYTAINDRLGYTAENAANKGVAGGYASLDGAGLVPATQLPSYPVTKGGTGTNTQFTAGSVVFAGASGVYSQDNAQLFWDDTNNRLGIGTNSPGAKLEVNGSTWLKVASGNVGLNWQSDTTDYAIYLNKADNSMRWYANVGTAGDRMTLDASGSLGIGNSSPSSYGKFSVTGTLGTVSVNADGNTLGFSRVGSNYVYSPSGPLNYGAAQHIFVDGALTTEWMRINTSGNVGIGTSAPGDKLDVSGNVRLGWSADKKFWMEFSNDYRMGMRLDSNSRSTTIFATTATAGDGGYITFNTRAGAGSSTTDYGSERMRIDASGNVGIGVTPSAWSGGTALELPNGGFISSKSGGTVYVCGNTYYNAGFKYSGSDYATQYRQLQGTHAWFTAPSGTAGNAISFTQAMTLDASGNLAVGSGLSATARLIVASTTSTGEMRIQGSGTNSFYGGLYKDNGTGEFRITQADGGVGMTFFTGSSPSERMRIDSSGNVGIGTSVAPLKLSLMSGVSTNNTATPVVMLGSDRTDYYASINSVRGSASSYLGLSFSTSNNAAPAEVMRLDPAGNLLVGGTTAIGKITAFSAANGDILAAFRCTGTGTQRGLYVSADNSTGVVSLDATGAAAGSLAFKYGGTEAMRIDSSGNVGIGTSGQPDKLFVYANTAASALAVRNDGGGPLQTWATFGTERARITSGGDVLVGKTATSVGTDGVQLLATGYSGFSAAGTTALFLNRNTNDGTILEFGRNGVSAATMGLASSALTFGTSGSERMRIDSAGNVGLGVTPSAWGSGFKSIEVGNYSSLWNTNGGTIGVAYNAYHNGTSFVYRNSSVEAANYQQSLGAHYWFTAPSGTAGNAITFTQAMTLDASGRLGIGTNAAALVSKLTLEGALGTTGSQIQIVGTGVRSGYIGPSSNGFEFGTDSGGLVFRTGVTGNASVTTGTERMRIDSSGNLLVGTTTSSYTDSNSVVVSPGTYSGQINVQHATGSTSGNGFLVFTYAANNIGSISQNGTTGVLFNTSSDARLKENIAPADDAAALIDAIQVRKFDWKADGSHQRYGMVAQELLEVAPEAVSVPADEDEMMGVDYSKLVPMLIKEIQSLRARVAQLEGN